MTSLANLPSNQATSPADLHALAQRAAQQGGVGVGFLQILADHPAIGDDQAVILDQHRHGAGRVHGEVFGAAFPHTLHLQLERQTPLGEDQADFP